MRIGGWRALRLQKVISTEQPKKRAEQSRARAAYIFILRLVVGVRVCSWVIRHDRIRRRVRLGVNLRDRPVGSLNEIIPIPGILREVEVGVEGGEGVQR